MVPFGELPVDILSTYFRAFFLELMDERALTELQKLED